MPWHRTFLPLLKPAILTVFAISVTTCYVGFPAAAPYSAKGVEPTAGASGEAAESDSAPPAEAVELTESQSSTVKIEPVRTHIFRTEREVIGSVAYHEKEASQSHSPADGKSIFIVAYVPESYSPVIREGQPVTARMVAYPDRVFIGRVSALGVTVYDSGGNPAIDPNTHRISVRCEIADPGNALYPGMLGTILIQVRKPVESVALPQNGVVREGDGTMTAWVTADRRHFTRRVVKTGLRQDGYVQIAEGLEPGEQAVTDGAVFISNMLYALPSE